MPESLPLAFFSMPGGMEWIVIGLVALLIFGNRLPGVARSLGQALREFKSGLSGGDEGAKKNESSGTAKPDAATKSDVVAKSEEKKPDDDGGA